jgi:SecD/SecF fusion protein
MPWYVNSLFAAAQEPSSWAWVKLLVAVGVLVLSFALGNFLGKKLRMQDHGWKIGLSLFALFASIAVLTMGPRIRLGVDLSGGAILVYEVDQEKKENKHRALDSQQMNDLLDAIKRRVNPGGQKEVIIRAYGQEQVEVIIPEKDEAEIARIERIISRTGVLEFRILANTRDNKELIDRALAETSKGRLLSSTGELEGYWVPVKEEEVQALVSYRDIALRKVTKAGKEVVEVLLVPDEYNVTGGDLSMAYTDTDEQGKPCVKFTFNSDGAHRFGMLTGTHLPDEVNPREINYKLGVVLDGILYSAPSIQAQISHSGQITGSFTQKDTQELVNVLNAGRLPATLRKEPISKMYSGATLGEDTIRKSTTAMIIASILVPLFMIWYYRFSGLVADIALILNMLMLLAIMFAFKAAFTLTGFAGLALTVGMAVDNNVLVYERLREELERGATLRMAIRNAFQRASATIIDANLTTLIAAIVMYVIGTDQIKGFAVPLGFGVAISMFTSVFVARVIFDVAEKRQWITKVKMLRVIGHTKIDFMHWFPYTITASALITVMAIGVSWIRGEGLFDIDFTGGVSVQVVFKDPQKIDTVRETLGKRSDELPDLAVTDVQMIGQESGYQFVINTSQQSMQRVQDVLTEVFGKKLAYNTLQVGDVAAIPAGGSVTPAKAAESKPAEPVKTEPAKGQSRHDVRPRALLASTEADLLMLAMADDKATKPAEKAAEKPTEPAAEKKPVEKPAATQSGQYANGTQAELKFAIPVTYEGVKQLVTAAMEQQKIPVEATPFELSNKDYREDDRTAYANWTLKTVLPKARAEGLLKAVSDSIAATPIFPASSTIGSAVAGKTQQLAILSLVASWICMIVYLWVRFQGVAFGLAAVVALVHDVFVMLGAIAISYYIAPFFGFLLIEPFKVNLTIVAAFLTIIGYSVNDTIIVFDRIREIRGKDPNVTREMVNNSTNQTLSRTLITSFTVFLVVFILYLSGGEAVHGFAFVLMVGIATGTYSSIYIAAPILLWLAGKRHVVAAIIER